MRCLFLQFPVPGTSVLTKRQEIRVFSSGVQVVTYFLQVRDDDIRYSYDKERSSVCLQTASTRSQVKVML
jgi:hypothetical protein